MKKHDKFAVPAFGDLDSVRCVAQLAAIYRRTDVRWAATSARKGACTAGGGADNERNYKGANLNPRKHANSPLGANARVKPRRVVERNTWQALPAMCFA